MPTNQANVKGGQTQLIPVKFDTRNLTPNAYQGQALVICVSCKSEATCTQDREILQVNLNVTGDPPASASPSTPPSESDTQPPATSPANPSSCSLLNRIVHVERDPAHRVDDLWLIKIKNCGRRNFRHLHSVGEQSFAKIL